MHVLIAAGGTGGHVYPGIAVAQQLKKSKVEILFVGRLNNIESRIVAKYNFSYKGIYSEPLPRKISLSIFKFFIKLIIAFFQSLFLIRKFKPDVIVGTGGYVSFTVIAGGWLLKVPTVIHEQNIVPGLTNRILAKIAKKVTVSFIASKKYFTRQEVIISGNPVREEILSLDRDSAIKTLELNKNKITVLVLGGSSGAHTLNLAVIDSLDFLATVRDKIQIIHTTGLDDYELVRSAYQEKGYSARVARFMYDIENAYKSADLVICRAGATTLAEVTALGLPSIVVPYPFATDEHQKKNAQLLADNKAAIMILDRNVGGSKLSVEILNLIQDKKKLALMAANSRKLGKPAAAEEIAELIYFLSG